MNPGCPAQEMCEKHWSADPKKILLKSTVSKLKRCFGPYVDYDIFFGQVVYISEDDPVDESNYFNFYLHKRTEFELERELRVFLFDDGDISLIPESEPYDPWSFESYPESIKEGIVVPADPDILIDEVIVSSDAPARYAKKVSSLLQKSGFPADFVSVSSY